MSTTGTTGRTQKYGAAVSTSDLTSLAALDVSGLTPGTLCYVLSEGVNYQLKIGGTTVPASGVDGIGWEPGGNTGVESVTGALVDNTDPNNPTVNLVGTVTIDNDGGSEPSVLQLEDGDSAAVSASGTGAIRYSDSGTILQRSVDGGPWVDMVTGTLADLYQYGLGNNPTVANLLQGTMFGIYFNPEGGVEIKQDPSTSPTGVPLFARAYSTLSSSALVGRFANRIGADHTKGGVLFDYYTVNAAASAALNIAIEETNTADDKVTLPGYIPNYTDSGPYSTRILSLLNQIGTGNFTRIEWTSTGGHFRACLFPPNGSGPAMNIATQLSFSGTAGAADDGSVISYQLCNGTSFGINTEVASMRGVLTDSNFGGGEAAGEWQFWVSTLADDDNAALSIGPGLVTVKDYASNDIAALQLESGESSPLSSAGTAALRYNAGTDKIQYSKNGGAWTDLV